VTDETRDISQSHSQVFHTFRDVHERAFVSADVIVEEMLALLEGAIAAIAVPEPVAVGLMGDGADEGAVAVGEE
jgi:hypothetical protein